MMTLSVRYTSCGLLLFLALSAFAFRARAPEVDHLLVLKSKHQLQLLNGDVIVKSYTVALGSGGLGPKIHEGDQRTPEGFYHINGRNAHSRFHLALHLSYPEEADKQRARELGVRPGANIMIHGLGRQFRALGQKHHLYDWTDGCIAVTDAEIEEIWRLVPDGAPVEIRP
jgi:murein L,D-transpeptidase YafK